MNQKISSLLRHAALGIFTLSAVAGQASAANIDLGSQLPPSQLSIGNTFASAVGVFHDDFLFSIPVASTDSITSTISLGNMFGISNLQTSLYSGTTIPLSMPNGTMLASSNLLSFSGTNWTASSAIINPITLGAGSYILHVMGNVTGTAGGSYAGVLNISAVPEADEWALMLAGFGLIGFIATRRKSSEELALA